MLSFPHAKINLGLRVLNKRSDGFHNIETVFYPVDWCDALEVVERNPDQNKKVDFSVSGNARISVQDNLCVRASYIMDRDFQIPPIKAWLHKLIPIGAGLGGGSSDGAFMFKLLNNLFDLKISNEKMKKYALQLGSDCPFFIDARPALATGRGEALEEIPEVLKNYFICIVKPPFSISTAEAYSLVKPAVPVTSLRELILLPVREWKNIIVNDFEIPMAKKYPEINSIRKKFYDAGAIFSLMSGSGSAVYGIFETETDAKKIFPDFVCWSGKI